MPSAIASLPQWTANGQPPAPSQSWFGDAGDAVGEDGTARLSVSRPVALEIECVPDVLGAAAASWLGTPDGTDAAGLTRYLCDLHLRVSPEGHGLFRKAAVVSLGQPTRSGRGWKMPLEWRASSLAPLFPVFVGVLVVDPAGLSLRGSYAPPLGVVGAVLDRALLSIAARGTARWFLAKVDAAITGRMTT